MNQLTEVRISLQDGFEADYGPWKQRRSKYEATFCDICGDFTKERKKYCTKHIENAPYIAALLEQLKKHEKENAAALRGKVSLEANTPKDILAYLNSVEENREDPRRRGSTKQIATRLGLEQKVVLAFAKKMHREGALRLAKHTKGWWVELV